MRYDTIEEYLRKMIEGKHPDSKYACFLFRLMSKEVEYRNEGIHFLKEMKSTPQGSGYLNWCRHNLTEKIDKKLVTYVGLVNKLHDVPPYYKRHYMNYKCQRDGYQGHEHDITYLQCFADLEV